MFYLGIGIFPIVSELCSTSSLCWYTRRAWRQHRAQCRILSTWSGSGGRSRLSSDGRGGGGSSSIGGGVGGAFRQDQHIKLDSSVILLGKKIYFLCNISLTFSWWRWCRLLIRQRWHEWCNFYWKSKSMLTGQYYLEVRPFFELKMSVFALLDPSNLVYFYRVQNGSSHFQLRVYVRPGVRLFRR